jgi:hypothetical protein
VVPCSSDVTLRCYFKKRGLLRELVLHYEEATSEELYPFLSATRTLSMFASPVDTSAGTVPEDQERLSFV